MAAAYPDMFKAGATYFARPSRLLPVRRRRRRRLELVLRAGPSQRLSGSVCIRDGWHGRQRALPEEADLARLTGTTLYPQNYQETIDQWTGVFGLSLTPTVSQQNTLQSGYRTDTFGSQVRGIWATEVGRACVLAPGLRGDNSSNCYVPESTSTRPWHGLDTPEGRDEGRDVADMAAMG
ncbi:MAG: hypothetical protein MMC23_004099 [Stictis urceolatum]|nr:hypothetical protein [Stictis urceolata]